MMNIYKLSLVVFSFMFIVSACEKDSDTTKTFEYTYLDDVDGNHYKAVTVGSQVIMAENLRTTKYNDSTDIPNVTENEEWASLSTPAYCWYDNDEESYKNTYGALYNWHTIETEKLCPTGWHVPTVSEWKTLEQFVNDDGHNQAIGRALKSVDGWKLLDGHSEYRGTDNYGCKIFPSGERKRNGLFVDAGEQVYIWVNTPGIETGYANMRIYQYQGKQNYSAQDNLTVGAAVRCMKD